MALWHRAVVWKWLTGKLELHRIPGWTWLLLSDRYPRILVDVSSAEAN